MARPELRYDKMVERALRSVVRDAIAQTAEHGLPGAHHFYITFRTSYPGVDIPEFLRTQYPGDMTIVLEHQFWGLEVEGDGFAVTLSFHSQAQRLVIPFAAVTAFADPSVKFGLEFQGDTTDHPTAGSKPALLPVPAASAPEEKALPDKPAEVVQLNAFRKK